jgi:uncharacterized protein (TIGR03437 family)
MTASGESPSAIQWNLNFSTVDIVSAQVSAGPSAAAGGKIVQCVPKAFGMTCLATGLNANLIPEGIVAVATFQLTGSPSTALSVQVTNVVATTATGTTQSSTGVGGAINIALPGPPVLSSLSCTGLTIAPGGFLSCTAFLSKPAETPTTIAISSSGTVLTAPGSVLIPAGTASATFTVAALPLGSGAVTLSAAYGGATKTLGLTIQATTSFNLLLACIPANLTPPATTPCRVNVTPPVATPLTVALASKDSHVTLPTSVTVPAGAIQANFTATATAVSVGTLVEVTAANGGQTTRSFLYLSPGASQPPALSSLSCNTSSLAPGGSASCTAALSSAAVDPATVTVSHDGQQSLSAPVSVVIPTGSSSAGFIVTASAGAANGTVTLSVAHGGVTKTYALTIQATPLQMQLSCTPSTLMPPGTVQCSLAMMPAPTAALTVSLSSNNSHLTVPTSVTAAAGAAQVSFTAAATAVSADTSAQITASAGGQTSTTAILLKPAPLTLSSLGCSTSMTAPGGSATCTATLSRADASDVVITISHDGQQSLSAPASVVIPAGSISAGFTVTVSSGAANGTVNLSVVYGGVTRTYALTIQSTSFQMLLSCIPANLTPPAATPCRVNVAPPVATPLTVALASKDSHVTLPASVTVLAGATQADFTATATAVSVGTLVEITVANGGQTAKSFLFLSPGAPALASLSCNASSLAPGGSASCTATLSTAAVDPVTVTVSHDGQQLLSAPASVVIPAGSSSASFTVTASSDAASTVTLTGAHGGVTKTYALTIQAAPLTLSSVGCNASSLVAPGGSTTCTATLSRTDAAATTVAISHDGQQSVTVPASVVIPGGSISASFPVTASSGAGTVTLTLAYGGATKTYALTIQPLQMQLSCTPADLTPPGAVQCSLAMTPAPAAALTVSLSSNDGHLTVPGSVAAPAGAAQVSFTAAATAVNADTSVQITASVGGQTSTAAVLLKPAPLMLSSVECNTFTLAPGGTATCTASLSRTNGADTVIAISHDGQQRLTTPALVVIPAGSVSASFAATAASGASGTVTLSVSHGGVTKTYVLTIQSASFYMLMSCIPANLMPPATTPCRLMLTPAPTAPVIVALTSKDSHVTLPASVTVPAGVVQVNFTATATAVTAGTLVQVTASAAGKTANAYLYLMPRTARSSLNCDPAEAGDGQESACLTESRIRPTSLECGPNPASSGAALLCTVSFDGPAAADTAVWLASSSGQVVVSGAGPVAAPVGAARMRFVALTGEAAAEQTVRIAAGVEDAGVFTEVVLKATPSSAEADGAARLPLGAACSPGSMAAIGGIAAASQDGTPAASVRIDGDAGVALVTAGGRIVFVCPSRWPSDEVVIAVEAADTASEVVRIPMREATPGILTVDDVHLGQGMIVTPESGELAGQSSPAAKASPVRPGDRVSVYVTGLGAAARLHSDGGGILKDDAALRSRIQLLVDGRPAEVVYATALPGLPGIYQVDAIIPPATAPGGAVAVEIRVALTDGTPAITNQATISVAGAIGQ